MKARLTPILAMLAGLGWSACATAQDQVQPAGPVFEDELRGTLEDNVYTSPNGSFRVALPPLSDDWRIVEAHLPLGMKVLVFDDLCRIFSVSEGPVPPGDDLADALAQQVRLAGVTVLEHEMVDTATGPAAHLLLRGDGFVCGLRTPNGPAVAQDITMDVASYAMERDGRMYAVAYQAGVDQLADTVDGVRRLPVKAVLDPFFAGFRVLEQPAVQHLPGPHGADDAVVIQLDAPDGR